MFTCRGETRTYLKEQLDTVEKPYQKFIKMVEESQQLAEEDRKQVEQEREKNKQQRSHMMKYRDNNKVVRKKRLIMYMQMVAAGHTSYGFVNYFTPTD